MFGRHAGIGNEEGRRCEDGPATRSTEIRAGVPIHFAPVATGNVEALEGDWPALASPDGGGADKGGVTHSPATDGGGEGEIRTHEPRAGSPAFKPRHPHARGTLARNCAEVWF